MFGEVLGVWFQLYNIYIYKIICISVYSHSQLKDATGLTLQLVMNTIVIASWQNPNRTPTVPFEDTVYQQPSATMRNSRTTSGNSERSSRHHLCGKVSRFLWFHYRWGLRTDALEFMEFHGSSWDLMRFEPSTYVCWLTPMKTIIRANSLNIPWRIIKKPPLRQSDMSTELGDHEGLKRSASHKTAIGNAQIGIFSSP